VETESSRLARIAIVVEPVAAQTIHAATQPHASSSRTRFAIQVMRIAARALANLLPMARFVVPVQGLATLKKHAVGLQLLAQRMPPLQMERHAAIQVACPAPLANAPLAIFNVKPSWDPTLKETTLMPAPQMGVRSLVPLLNLVQMFAIPCNKISLTARHVKVEGNVTTANVKAPA